MVSVFAPCFCRVKLGLERTFRRRFSSRCRLSRCSPVPTILTTRIRRNAPSPPVVSAESGYMSLRIMTARMKISPPLLSSGGVSLLCAPFSCACFRPHASYPPSFVLPTTLQYFPKVFRGQGGEAPLPVRGGRRRARLPGNVFRVPRLQTGFHEARGEWGEMAP